MQLELLWLLTEAAKLCPRLHVDLAADLEVDLRAQIVELDAIACAPVTSLPEVDLGPTPTAQAHSARSKGSSEVVSPASLRRASSLSGLHVGDMCTSRDTDAAMASAAAWRREQAAYGW